MAQYQVAFYMNVNADDDKSAIVAFIDQMDELENTGQVFFITKKEQEPAQTYLITDDQMDLLMDDNLNLDDLNLLSIDNINNDFIV